MNGMPDSLPYWIGGALALFQAALKKDPANARAKAGLRRVAQSFVVQARYLELAEKAARTMAMLTERLDQHRSRGQQQITVKHVTVNADQALVADSINTGGPSRSSAPARSPGNLLTTGNQKPMETLNGDLVEVGGEKEI